MSIAIELSHIFKSFGHFKALRDVDLTIEAGDFFALLGPNGAGKTTLISILAGLLKADHGSAKIGGHDVTSQYREARRRIGIVPQELVFDPFFTVRETLQFQSGYFGLKKNNTWIDELLFHLSLQDKANTNMRTLSGGMKRRVMVAQALVHRPPVIVLDEPTAGVDVELRQTLWTFIEHLNQEGHTIILTTHYLEEAEKLCNRIGILRNGQLIALEDKKQMMQKHHAHCVFFTLHEGESLPNSLLPLLDQKKDNGFSLRFNHSQDLEHILSVLRQHQCHVDDIEIRKPDLEDIFIATIESHTKDTQHV